MDSKGLDKVKVEEAGTTIEEYAFSSSLLS